MAATLSPHALTVLQKRYLLKDKQGNIIETPDDLFRRVAKCAARPEREPDQENWESVFYDMISNLEFLPNSPALFNAGTDNEMVFACFVLEPQDDMRSILQTNTDAGLIYKMGGGVGFNFGKLRSSKAGISTTGGTSSGPISFMQIYDRTVAAVMAAGKRRGAALGALSVNHPDIMQFIKCKSDQTSLQNFNLSVGITDAFMEAVIEDENIYLVEPHTKVKVRPKVKARDIWNAIVENAWETGDPGLLFIDTINRANPTPDLGTINATNPCTLGETLITTKDGDVRIDSRIGKETEIWNGYEWSVVTPEITGYNVHCIKFTFSNGRELVVTDYHKFWIFDSISKLSIKVEAKEIVVDDLVSAYFTPEGIECDAVFVEKIEDYGIADIVYCFNESKRHKGMFNGIVTAQCGESIIPPKSSCCLGSINLMNMITDGVFNFDKFAKTISHGIRFLDNLIDVNKYPFDYVEEVTKRDRRIGLGIMGFADLLIHEGISYASEEAIEYANKLFSFMKKEATKATERLGKEKGSFPAFDQSIYAGGKLRRNADITSCAPTGSISMIAGVSAGIEPLFSMVETKTVMDGTNFTKVNEPLMKHCENNNIAPEKIAEFISTGNIESLGLPDSVKSIFISANDIPCELHIKMQSTIQKYISMSVSKSVNLPNSATKEDVANAFMLAWKSGCKGTTIFRDGCRKLQVYTKGTDKMMGGEQQGEGPVAKVYKRPKKMKGQTHQVSMGQCDNLYVTINKEGDNGDGQIRESICELGKSGDCQKALFEWGGKLVSLLLHYGVPIEKVISKGKGIKCTQACLQYSSCPDAVSKLLEEEANVKVETKLNPYDPRKRCPSCGGEMRIESSCLVCSSCGTSSCGGL